MDKFRIYKYSPLRIDLTSLDGLKIGSMNTKGLSNLLQVHREVKKRLYGFPARKINATITNTTTNQQKELIIKL